MKKSLTVALGFGLAVLLLAGTQVFADNTAASASTTPAPSAHKGTKSKKKKSAVVPTPQATAGMTATTTAQVAASPTAVPKTAVASSSVTASTPTLFSGNERLYDRVGEPGDLQKAIAAAARAIGSGSLKHDRAVFLWLGRVTNGSDYMKANSYVRFNLAGIAYAGPKKPSLVLTGTISDQSGSDFKAGDPISVAVDFREIKVDYEGTKLGEVNKGSDIAQEVFEILNEYSSYQWVLVAQDQMRDPQDSMGIPTFVVKAQDGYAFLSNPSNH